MTGPEDNADDLLNCKYHKRFQSRMSHVRPLVKWCLDNSICAHIKMPPVSLPDLASALISALESNTANTVATELPTTFDVLIAEDNPVNQKLAQRFLEKYSHGVEIAENGLLAVEAYKARAEQGRRFDAVLVSLRSHVGMLLN